MQITSRFTIGIQTMLCIAYFSESKKVTSELIAHSTNANPVIIRRIIGQLKKAGLIDVKAGVGGSHLLKDPKQITLLDIFLAVDAQENELFSFHSNPECECPVGKNFHSIVNSHLKNIEDSMLEQMKKTNLEQLLIETKSKLKLE